MRALVPALTIVAAGLLLCAVFAMPRENTSLTSVRHSLEGRELGAAVVTSATKPHRIFPDLLAPDPSILSVPVFALAMLGLIGRPPLFLAAAGAQVLFGAIFLVVYPGSYRHQGLYLVFLVFLYWLLAESAPWKGIPLRRQLFVRDSQGHRCVPGGSGRRPGAALGLGRYPLGEERQPQAREVSAQLGSLSGRDSRS